jgi:transcriptional regulator with XRE-family HTH domain
MVSESVDPPAVGAGGESIGALLSRLRMEQGKSQLRVAELLCAASGLTTITRHEISRWEREERIPTSGWLRWLAVVLDASLPELELAAAHAREQREAEMTITRYPSRDRFSSRASATAPANDPWMAHRAAARPWPTSAQPDDPAALRERVLELRRMDDLIAGGEIVGLVHREFRAAVVTVRDHPERFTCAEATETTAPATRPVRTGLSIVAELAQLAGWVAADSGAPVSALATYRVGLRAADASGDRPLAGHLVSCLGQLTAEDGDPSAALRLARSARRRAWSAASATTRALLSVRLAYAAALAGERSGCDAAITAAEQAYERRERQRDPDWLYWLDEAHFTAMVGRSYAALGRHRLARPLLAAALDAGSVRFRARAIIAAALVRAHADAGDLDAACALAGDALLTCVRAGSVRATRQVRAVEPHLRAAAHGAGQPAAMKDYAELAASLRAYLPADRPDRVYPRRAERPDSARFRRVAQQGGAHSARVTLTMQDARDGPRPTGESNSG